MKKHSIILIGLLLLGSLWAASVRRNSSTSGNRADMVVANRPAQRHRLPHATHAILQHAAPD